MKYEVFCRKLFDLFEEGIKSGFLIEDELESAVIDQINGMPLGDATGVKEWRSLRALEWPRKDITNRMADQEKLLRNLKIIIVLSAISAITGLISLIATAILKCFS